ncbi:uncharacterized protein F5891DRAFT_1195067 [Suillus fuscotomentosus]|uniref:Uncharacterized protein n=1 Tax=Suillus fuscotomentosus TaxID=1912939 RepID=A0AAD4DVB4_9AGAM|nr:uncharacterized protein F5891DRAFT_1195067 [Suillus fuscotomentosus]KAG1894625.1 hypothetical protein F5891DRAFT_1195067 [Suillus fuscotomentosus]
MLPVRDTPAQMQLHLADQLSLLIYQSVHNVELQRAKNQLKWSLMMALKSRAVEVEDLGWQLLVHGRRIPVTEMIAAIDKVTPDCMCRIATRLFTPSSGNKAIILMMRCGDIRVGRQCLTYGVAGA